MTEWYYGKDGQQHGPVDEATLRARAARGEVGPEDLVWCEGMENWQAYRVVMGGSSDPPPLASEAKEAPQGPPPAGDPSPYAPPSASPEGADYRAAPGVAATNGLAIASMVCGILSLVFFCLCGGVFFGIPAVICGHLGLNQLNAPENKQQGRGMALAGLICGYLGLAVFLLLLITGDTNVQYESVDW